MADTVLVRIGSHRANSRLARLLEVEKLDGYYTWQDGGCFALIPATRLAEARAIPGITRARPNGEVHRCWPSSLSDREEVAP